MKKNRTLLIVAVMIASMLWTVSAAADEESAQDTAPTEETADDGGSVQVTFSTGETADAVPGEPFVFFFRCEEPGDLGEPADGEEGAGITVSGGTVEYSHVFLGGPNRYPVSELVTVTGFEGDFTVYVADTATQMDAAHTIYFTQEEIDAAIREEEEREEQMTDDPADVDPEGSGAPEGGGTAEGGDPEGGSPEGETPAQAETPEDESPDEEVPAQDAVPEGEVPEQEGNTGGEIPSREETPEKDTSSQNGASGSTTPVNGQPGPEPPRQEPPGPEPPRSEAPGGQAAAVKKEEQKQEKEEIVFTPYSSKEGYTVYGVKMLLQAGYQEFRNYSTQGSTLQSGIGFLDPFGEAYYYAGEGFPESFAVPEDIYVSDWMDANFGCRLFCIYHTAAGDIYAWEGVYGANRTDPAEDIPDESEADDDLDKTADTDGEAGGSPAVREDVRIGLVAGGTGMFKGSYGVLVGVTSSSGIYDTAGRDVELPQSLFRDMEGYIVVPDACETASLNTVTQKIAENTSELEVRGTEYTMVPVTLRMQAGSLEEYEKEGRGIGSLAPFCTGTLTADSYDCPASQEYDVRDYVNDNWLSVYGRPEFVTFHIDDGIASGDVYAYRFSYAKILDPSSELAQSGNETAECILMIGGTDDFEGVTGMLSGTGAAADPAGWGIADYGNDAPLLRQIRAEGYMKVPAASPAALYGSEIITGGEE